MLSDKASLDTRVGWIRQETDQQLEQIKTDLTAYNERQDSSLLERCKQGLSEILNTMHITGIQGGERLAREMYDLVEDLIAGKVNDKVSSLLVLQKGASQISEYLQHLQDGYADLPIVILPLLNDLRAARGDELLSELLVFLPEEGAVGNQQIGTDEYMSLGPEKRTKIYQHLRMHFQHALLSWYKQTQTPKALNKLHALSHDMIRIHEDISVRVLWWLSKALTEGLRDNRLEHGVAVKLVMGNLERLILRLSQTDIDEQGALPELDDMKKNLLYYIGMAEKGSPQVDAVKEAFLLDVYLPQGESLEKLRKHYASPGQKLWRSVADTVNEDIESIIDGFQTMELNPDEGIVQLIIDKSSRTATTLGMLGLGKLATIIDQQVDEFKLFKKNPQVFNKERRIDVATQWLRVKDILEEYAETGEDVTIKLFDENGGYRVSDYSARKQVLKIIESRLTSAMKSLDEYAQDGDAQHLGSTEESLKTIDKTLKFLKHKEAYPLIDGVICYLNDYTKENAEVPDPEDIKRLAEVLAALETSVIALRNNADHLMCLEPGYDAIKALHSSHGLYDAIEQELSDASRENHSLKKQQRQKKMEAILAV